MKICSIIVTYNPDIDSFRSCLYAQLNSGSDKILVVDNGSTNYSKIKQLSNELDLLEIISLDTNMGIAFAQNVGIKYASKNNFSFVLLFDQDTIIPEDYASKILNVYLKIKLEFTDKIAVVGPNYIDQLTLNYYPQVILKGCKLKEVYPNTQQSEYIEISFIIASGSLIKLETINEVGFMDEKLFIDGVDIEWCLRAKAKGFKTFVATRINVFHSIGDTRLQSLGRNVAIHSPIRRYYMARNNILILRYKNIPFGFKLRKIVSVLSSISIHLYEFKFSKEYMYYIFKGFYHGVIGKSGKYK